MTCPNCGAGLDDRSRYCNFCGQAQQPVPPGPQPFPNGAEGEEPHRRCYQEPQAPPQGLQGLGSALGGKAYLVLSVCCFGWAGLVGLPRCIGFIASLLSWSWNSFSWSFISGFFSLGLHLILPLVAGAVLLNMHKRSEQNQ